MLTKLTQCSSIAMEALSFCRAQRPAAGPHGPCDTLPYRASEKVCASLWPLAPNTADRKVGIVVDAPQCEKCFSTH